MIQTMKKIKLYITTLLTLIALVAAPLPAFAASSGTTCGETKTGLIGCSAKKSGVQSINDLISIAVSVMTVVIGVVAVAGLAYAGILYASARDNQTQVSQAITIIRNIVIGLVLYGFTIAIINWLIPGGVIG